MNIQTLPLTHIRTLHSTC
jgi:hypothetical protein